METIREKPATIILLFLVAGIAVTSCTQTPQSMLTEIPLSGNWMLAPDSLLKTDGKSISQTGFYSPAWIPAKVPHNRTINGFLQSLKLSALLCPFAECRMGLSFNSPFDYDKYQNTALIATGNEVWRLVQISLSLLNRLARMANL